MQSDLKNAIPIQIGINKLVNDLLVSAEFGAFRQRWVISNADGIDALRNSPNEVWDIPAGDGMGQDTAVGDFQATQLQNFVQGIDHLANALASITRTPKHFVFQARSNMSGESLLAMEAPLVAKAQKRIDRFTPEWRRALAFLLRLDGQRVGPEMIETVWESTYSLTAAARGDSAGEGGQGGGSAQDTSAAARVDREGVEAD